jgi:hypothetical protein
MKICAYPFVVIARLCWTRARSTDLNIAKVSYGATWYQNCRKDLFSGKLQRYIVVFTRVEETSAR